MGTPHAHFPLGEASLRVNPNPMCISGTLITFHPEFGLWIKHEEQSCPEGPFTAKSRGIWPHLSKRPEKVIGVLDTDHSQGGWAVARACALLGKRCVEFYPVRKACPDWKGDVQLQCQKLGAIIVPLAATRSVVLYSRAKRWLSEREPDNYMVPNALKLPETVSELAREIRNMSLPLVPLVLVSAGTGTIAAGVLSGLQSGWKGKVIVHLGYSRPLAAVRAYISNLLGFSPGLEFDIVDEGYGYADKAKPCGKAAPCLMSPYYCLKAFSWWVRCGRAKYGEALLINTGYIPGLGD